MHYTFVHPNKHAWMQLVSSGLSNLPNSSESGLNKFFAVPFDLAEYSRINSHRPQDGYRFSYFQRTTGATISAIRKTFVQLRYFFIKHNRWRQIALSRVSVRFHHRIDRARSNVVINDFDDRWMDLRPSQRWLVNRRKSRNAKDAQTNPPLFTRKMNASTRQSVVEMSKKVVRSLTLVDLFHDILEMRTIGSLFDLSRGNSPRKGLIFRWYFLFRMHPVHSRPCTMWENETRQMSGEMYEIVIMLVIFYDCCDFSHWSINVTKAYECDVQNH